ncbi:8171_t:CDS:1, partial [Cetraspora pellucida]
SWIGWCLEELIVLGRVTIISHEGDGVITHGDDIISFGGDVGVISLGGDSFFITAHFSYLNTKKS